MRAKFWVVPVGTIVLLSSLVGAVAPAQALGVATVSAPGVPTHVVTSGATPRTMNVTWTAPVSNGGEPITDYSVEYRKIGESTWSRFRDGESAETSATISGLSGSSFYEFRVGAWNSQRSNWSPRESVVAAGDFSSCAVMASGSAKCWGDNTNLQLGHSGATYGDAAAQVATFEGAGSTTTVVSLAAGSAHSCAVLADGSAKCWGAALSGRLGDGAGEPSDTPLLVAGLDGTSPGKSVVAITAGSSHTCAVLGDGSAKCWGANFSGQLGNGTTDSGSEPVAVTGLDGTAPDKTALSISAGGSQSCAVLADGSAKCWGSNVSGRLGNPSEDDSLVPVLVSGLDGSTLAKSVRSIATAVQHTCVVLGTGGVSCWGANFNGQLGDGTTNASNTPVAVPDIDGTTPAKTAIAVSLGEAHTCALLATGAVKCWGGDDRNELGSGPGTSLTPVTVTDVDGTSLDKTAVALAVGGTHSCVVLATGATKCWGGNTRGELGSLTGTAQTVPITVPGVDGISQQSMTATTGFGATAPIEAPGAPTGVTAANPTTSSLEVSWTAPQSDGGSVIVSYVLQYRIAGANQWSTFSREDSPATSVVVTGLASNTSYEFNVAAANVLLTGSYTPTVTSTRTLSGGPSAPGLVIALPPTATKCRVVWSAPDPGTSPISDYVVQFRTLTAQTWTTVSHRASTSTLLDVSGLAAGTTYLFRVAAVNGAGPGAYSAESNAVATLVLPGAPGKPKIVTRSNTSVGISWTAAVANGSPITSYRVEYQADGRAWKSLAPTTYTTRAATVTAQEGSTYVFRVSAISAAGTGPSSPVSLSALAASAPSAPIQLTAGTTNFAGQIAVSWGKANLHGAPFGRYTVAWKVKGGAWQAEEDPVLLWRHLITGLKKGVTYFVRVTVTTIEGSAASTSLGILITK